MSLFCPRGLSTECSDLLRHSCVNSVQECPDGGVRTSNVNFTRPEDGVMCVREYNFVESELDVLP